MQEVLSFMAVQRVVVIKQIAQIAASTTTINDETEFLSVVFYWAGFATADEPLDEQACKSIFLFLHFRHWSFLFLGFSFPSGRFRL